MGTVNSSRRARSKLESRPQGIHPALPPCPFSTSRPQIKNARRRCRSDGGWLQCRGGGMASFCMGTGWQVGCCPIPISSHRKLPLWAVSGLPTPHRSCQPEDCPLPLILTVSPQPVTSSCLLGLRDSLAPEQLNSGPNKEVRRYLGRLLYNK